VHGLFILLFDKVFCELVNEFLIRDCDHESHTDYVLSEQRSAVMSTKLTDIGDQMTLTNVPRTPNTIVKYK